MSKLTALIVVAVLAGCASANGASTSGWRALRVDGTSQAAFEKSVAAFQKALPRDRQLYFEVALQEIWGALAYKAGAEACVDEVAAVYFTQLNGLAYDEVIDVGGPEAKKTYLALSSQARQTLPPGMTGVQPGLAFTNETSINTFGPYPGQPLEPPQQSR